MPWLTTEEAAKILDYHPEYVRRLLRDGKITAKKFGRIWMVDEGHVLKLKQLLKRQKAAGYSKNDPRRGVD